MGADEDVVLTAVVGALGLGDAQPAGEGPRRRLHVVLGVIADAEHEESAPGAPTLLINRLSCSLVGTEQTITLVPGTLAQRIYGQSSVTEVFACNFGLNPAYRARIDDGELAIAGIDADGDVRLVELPSHPFFVATLYLPQVRSSAARPHPLIAAFLRAALDGKL